MMWIKILLVSCLSAILYNLGGQGKKGNYLDFFRNKLTRRIGCAVLQFFAIFFILKISALWWVHLCTIGFTWGFLSSYWDFINGEDRHGFHGAGIAFAMILYVIAGSIPWTTFLLRIILLGCFMELWSRTWTQDWIEEQGRGFSIPLSLLIFL